MTPTLTTPTLPDRLRQAADLIEAIGWPGGITWGGSGELGLHMSGGNPDPTDAIVERGATLLEHARQTGADYCLDRTTWQMPNGLTVTLYGQREQLDAETA